MRASLKIIEEKKSRQSGIALEPPHPSGFFFIMVIIFTGYRLNSFRRSRSANAKETHKIIQAKVVVLQDVRAQMV